MHVLTQNSSSVKNVLSTLQEINSPWVLHTLTSRTNEGVLINRVSENSVKYNKRGGGSRNKLGDLLIYFDWNDVNASKFAYIRTKL